jgi:afadin
MRRRRQQKLERKLQQFRSKDGGPDTGGTLKIYGEALCKDVPYKTLLLSIQDSAAYVVEEMLEKYGKDRKEAPNYCLVQVTVEPPQQHQGRHLGEQPVSREYYLYDDEAPLAILMNHPPSRGD